MLKENSLLTNWNCFLSFTIRVISSTPCHLSVANQDCSSFQGPKAALKIPLPCFSLFSDSITVFILFPFSTNSSANWASRRDINCGVAENGHYLCFPVLRRMNKIGYVNQPWTPPWVQAPICEQVPRATGACVVQCLIHLLGLVLHCRYLVHPSANKMFFATKKCIPCCSSIVWYLLQESPLQMKPSFAAGVEINKKFLSLWIFLLFYIFSLFNR